MKMIHMSVPGSEEATLEGYLLDCELSWARKNAGLRCWCALEAGTCTAPPGKQSLWP